jgi:subtilase family serine protease
MNGYAYWSGTSFAAPQVAAMIANQIPAAGSARQAVLQVLAQARWVPGLGPVLIPAAGLTD